MMRRYTLNISGREFIVDVQETDADNFEVIVGDETYEVNLAGGENLNETRIAPGLAPGAASAAAPVARKAAPPRPAPAAAPATAGAAAPVATARKPSGGGGKGTQTAPMPGVVLEVDVKPGDTVTRGQQVAILDAMKMHNVIGAAQAGTIAEVYVTAGQSVDHGTPLLKFKEE
ncbi:MAG: acetyl-CoA carboxylase biotin carboxyl carrier protein subunit [Candidatus Accumulibacter sp.]|jgi:biotin carboxyl carrier protein|nr:acetyl-CoA carboxylase biotin carboxyl carrier protein subunit [Accumulibacter sp.]